MPAHAGAVVGVAADSCNRRLLSAGADAVLCLWDFRSQRLSAELPLGSPVTHVALHAGSGLAAIACADRVVRMVDIDACRVVRRFSGHRCD
jgi:U3 small nucleolar RNA-associated protein 21